MERVKTNTQRLVVALGGNAMLRPGERGTAVEQRQNVAQSCHEIAQLVEDGYEIVITHGNGPQVGNLLIQNEGGRPMVPAMPLDICGAMTQGQLGYMIQSELMRELCALGLNRPVVTIVTQVVVDESDPAFQDPTKPIGPFFPEREARQLMTESGYTMKEDANRGWRRVVPSPQPVEIVEIGSIQALLAAGAMVIAAGGGGIPVKRCGSDYRGVEAVIDKDLSGELLAREVGAQGFIILTNVDRVFLRFGTPEERAINCMTATEARGYMEEGHFKAGSMQPKVEAATRFVESSGETAIITSLAQARAALRGEAGTRIVGG